MTSDDTPTATDGGVTKEDIFGTGEETERSSAPLGARLRQVFDLYVRAPFGIAWSDWRTRTGGIILIFYILLGTVGVWLYPETTINEGPRYLRPFQDVQFPMGTTDNGYDLASLIIHATPAMLKMMLAGVVISLGWGSLVGLISGYKGGMVDRALMTLTDTFAVIPGLPLIVVLAAIYPPTDPYLLGAMLAITMWAPLARELRSQVLTIRGEDYVEAARAMGLTTPTIIGQEVMPKLAPYILIRGAFNARGVIFGSVGLYFIGLLPMRGTENWGVILYNAYSQGDAHILLYERGHWLLVPMLTLAVLTFGLVLLSQGLDRVFNPRLRARHAKTVADEEGQE